MSSRTNALQDGWIIDAAVKDCWHLLFIYLFDLFHSRTERQQGITLYPQEHSGPPWCIIHLNMPNTRHSSFQRCPQFTAYVHAKCQLSNVGLSISSFTVAFTLASNSEWPYVRNHLIPLYKTTTENDAVATIQNLLWNSMKSHVHKSRLLIAAAKMNSIHC